jgi:hypothetical protein
MPLPQPAQRTVVTVKAGQIWQDAIGYFLIRSVGTETVFYWGIPDISDGWIEKDYFERNDVVLISDCISEEGMVQNGC